MQPPLQASHFISLIKSESDFKALPFSSQNMDFGADMSQNAIKSLHFITTKCKVIKDKKKIPCPLPMTTQSI